MISVEPGISVGIIDRTGIVHGTFNGHFELPNSVRLRGPFTVRCEKKTLVLSDNENVEVVRGGEIFCRSLNESTFTLNNVIIGIQFHWERKEDQSFEGNLRFLASGNETVSAINEIGIEKYLISVVSSEMSAGAPIELLKAHAITSRSWLLAMLERKRNGKGFSKSSQQIYETQDEIIRWHDREDHLFFDVCADDHCQRYQGITKVISHSAEEAVNATRGWFILHNNEICDARFSKVCGGRTELFENTWEDTPIPYLHSVSDSANNYPNISNEADAGRWINSRPDVYCNTSDVNILKQILPSFDRETMDFFRWKIEYSQEQIAGILKTKSGINFGIIKDISVLSRGPSGRINKLKITGSNKTVVVGKELEIRRWLSSSHLYSSAFIVNINRDASGLPVKFTVTGAGWGHGVGLCQVGAAVMAVKGFKADEIINHYFTNVELKKLY